MLMHRLRRAVTVALALTIAACGDDDDQSTATTEAAPATTEAAPATTEAAPATTEAAQATFPITIDAANGPVEIATEPTAIISLSPSATEMLFAIGAGEQVIAVDDQSNYPSDAPITDLSGFTPNVEAISGYEPDLVVVADDSADLTGALGPLGIPVLSLPAAQTFDDVYTQLEQLGAATGHLREAAELAAGLETEIGEIIADLPEQAASLSFYHELDGTFF